jgi:hypothetical protein
MTYLIHDITFYKVDDDGNEELNKDGITKVYRIKDGIRVKALEYLTDDFEDDMMTVDDEPNWDDRDEIYINI